MNRAKHLWLVSLLSVMAGHLLAQTPPPRVVSGQVFDENGQPIANACMSLVILSADEQSVYDKGQLSDSTGQFRFEDVPPGGGTLYLHNSSTGFCTGNTGTASSPIDIQRHAYQGSGDFVFFSVDIPASAGEVNINLQGGSSVELVVVNPPTNLVTKTFTSSSFGELFELPGPGRFRFRGLLVKNGNVAFRGSARFTGPGDSISTILGWPVPNVPVAPGGSVSVNVEVPALDFSNPSVMGTVMVGTTLFATANKPDITAAGYVIGEDLPYFNIFPSAVAVQLYRPSDGFTIKTHPGTDGHFSIAGVPPGTYRFYATYDFEKDTNPTSRVTLDSRSGRIKGNTADVIIGSTPRNIVVRFPATLPETAKRILEDKYSKDVTYEIQ